MTEPVPIRAVERQRITRPHEVIETERVVEYARVDDPTRAALPSGERVYDPERDSPLANTGMRLDAAADGPRAALPPGRPAPARPWWRWRR